MEVCQSCNKPFHVREHNLGMPGTKEKEPITCPYCQHTIERKTNGWWVVSPASEIELNEFENRRLNNEEQ